MPAGFGITSDSSCILLNFRCLEHGEVNRNLLRVLMGTGLGPEGICNLNAHRPHGHLDTDLTSSMVLSHC